MWQLSLEPRQWQLEALGVWRDHGRHGVASIVTGGGKTFFAFQCILDGRTIEPNLRTLIVVPTLALLDQWYLGLQDDLHVPAEDIASYSGEGRAKTPRAINILVLNTPRSTVGIVSKGQPTLLVVDECHRAASPVNAQAIKGDHRMTLGLSATPERDYDDLFHEVIEPALGPIIYEYDYNRGRRDGVIAQFELVNLKVPLNEEEERAYSRLTQRLGPLFRRREKGEFVDDQIQRLLQQRSRVSASAHSRLPNAVRLLDRHRRERAIVFHEQIENAEILTALLKGRGHRVASYHSGLGPSLRQDNLRMFRRGEIDVLVTCRALDEGINVPDAGLAVIVASTASTRQRIQRLGRVLRPAPGKSVATIYTLYATEPEAQRLRMEAEGLDGATELRWMTASR